MSLRRGRRPGDDEVRPRRRADQHGRHHHRCSCESEPGARNTAARVTVREDVATRSADRIRQRRGCGIRSRFRSRDSWIAGPQDVLCVRISLMRNRHVAAIALVCIIFVSAAVVSVARLAPPPPTWPGSLGNGVTLLPNGWKIQPAGRHMSIGDLPLAMVESPDGNFLVVTNNGYAKPTLTVVDLKRGYVASKVTIDHAWLGLAWHPDGRRVFSSGAGQTTVNEFYFASSKLTPGAVYALGRDTQKPMPGINRPEPVEQSFVGGIAISPDGRSVYAVHVLGEALTMLDIKSGLVKGTVDVGAEPYTCIVSPDAKTVFVSVWGGARVLLFNAATLERRAEIRVGEHPNAMVLSKDGARLFVACANTNSVWVLDLASNTAKEQVSVALFP